MQINKSDNVSFGLFYRKISHLKKIDIRAYSAAVKASGRLDKIGVNGKPDFFDNTFMMFLDDGNLSSLTLTIADSCKRKLKIQPNDSLPIRMIKNCFNHFNIKVLSPVQTSKTIIIEAGDTVETLVEKYVSAGQEGHWENIAKMSLARTMRPVKIVASNN